MNGTNATHDAQKLLADFRDHLARHDKPLAFLFGAGTSCAVRVTLGDQAQSLIPAVAGLTTLAKAEASFLGANFTQAWEAIEQDCRDIKQDPNIENILSRLRMMISAAGNTDTLAGLKRDEIQLLEEAVRKSIAKAVTPDLSLATDLPHRKFARWLAKTSRKNPVEVFTVNYDVLIEHALEIERIPAFDGFVGSYRPFFHPDSLRRAEAAPGSNWTRLWKMHGSVTWSRTEEDGRMRVIRGMPDPTGEMIYPSFQKYDESRQQPYSAFTDRLSRFLEQDDALLVVAGFSFGDEHINNLIFGALENRPRTHVYALQFGELAPEAELMKRATQRPNMIVIGPKTGIIGGRQAVWASLECPSFMNAVFEVKEEPSAGGGAEKSGRMKIGDFACFCDFIESMTVG
jgi:hypothetical protein